MVRPPKGNLKRVTVSVRMTPEAVNTIDSVVETLASIQGRGGVILPSSRSELIAHLVEREIESFASNVRVLKRNADNGFPEKPEETPEAEWWPGTVYGDWSVKSWATQMETSVKRSRG